MHPALIIFYLLFLIDLLIGAYLHGKKKKSKGKHSFWVTLLSRIFVILLLGWLISWKYLSYGG